MKSKKWLTGWVIIVFACLMIIAYCVYKVDPYMHYHMPRTFKYFYTLDNQRSQNDGILRHFDYDALITGTSMTENFKTTEMDEYFKCNAIKVPYSGGSFKEMNNCVETAIKNNNDLKIVLRSLDMDMFLDSKDRMRMDMGNYPTYLYDSNPFNDVQYVWNRDIIFNRVYKMVKEREEENFDPGITSFDDYSNWQYQYAFGAKILFPKGVQKFDKQEPVHLLDEEKETIEENINLNIIKIANENPQVTFYYFITPYSVAWWMEQVKNGTIYKQIEAEQYIIEMMLECDNIKLFSFNGRTDITFDLNNYKDIRHYAQWINSLILKWIHNGDYQLTKDNYRSYLEKELNDYLNFDYMSINNQEDYESDFYAAALLNKEYKGTKPLNVFELNSNNIHIKNAELIDNQHDNHVGLKCIGRLKRAAEDTGSIGDYIINTNDYTGAIIEAENNDFGYLSFYGRKTNDDGQPTVYVIDETGKKVGKVSVKNSELDNDWHLYVIDITKAKGDIRIILNGGCTDNSGNENSEYIFSDVYLY